MTTNYISSHGMVWGEMSSTGVVTSYGHDALGSVTETYQNGTLQNTYRYKPYGGLLAKTGTAPDPSFLWNGGSGYRATNLPNSDYYVRRRHYSTTSAKWTTADPLWPAQLPFGYVQGMVTGIADPSGMVPCPRCRPLNKTITKDSSFSVNVPVGFALFVYISWTNHTTTTVNINSDCSGTVSYMHYDELVLDGLTDSLVKFLCPLLAGAGLGGLATGNPEAAVVAKLIASMICWTGSTISKIPCVIMEDTYLPFVHTYQFKQSFTNNTTTHIGKCGSSTCNEIYQTTCGDKTTCDYQGACISFDPCH